MYPSNIPRGVEPIFTTPSTSSWIGQLRDWWQGMVTRSPFGSWFAPIGTNIINAETQYWQGFQQVHIQSQGTPIFANPWAAYAAKYQPQSSNGPAGNTYG